MRDKDETTKNKATAPSHDDVARRAYELFQNRGGEPGHDLEHWFDAERELSAWQSETDDIARLRGE
jgi:hypothetical protein